jgi:hypothetical protein
MVLTQSDLLLIVHRFQVPEKRSTAKLAVVRVGPIASLEKIVKLFLLIFFKKNLYLLVKVMKMIYIY